MSKMLELSQSWSVQLLATSLLSILLAAVYQFRLYFRFNRNHGFARMGISPGAFGGKLDAARNEFAMNSSQIISDGYNRFKDGLFMIQTADLPRLVVPLRLLDELKALPETLLSHREALADRFLGSYHGMENLRRSHIHSDVCRLQLVQNLPSLVKPMSAEVDEALLTRLPGKDDETAEGPWQPVKVASIMSEALSALNGRIFVGPELCRSETWSKATDSYTKALFMSTAELGKYHPLVRPLVEPFLQSVKSLKQASTNAINLLKPLIEKRRKYRKNSSLKDKDGEQSRPQDILQWMVDLAEGEDATDYCLTIKILFISIVTHKANGEAVQQSLFDFVAAPDSLKQRLRDEARRELKAAGGRWNLTAINRMQAMDAFLKESQRLNGAALLAFNRKTLQPIQLSDGTRIPAGVILTIPSRNIAHDAAYWPEPERFSIERHLDPAETESAKSRKQFANLDPHVLGFGYGRFACPGRVYVATQMKLLLATLILNWDWRWANGATERPSNVVFNDMVLANPKAELEARRL